MGENVLGRMLTETVVTQFKVLSQQWRYYLSQVVRHTRLFTISD